MEQSEIKLFEGQNIRYVWDEEKEQYFFSVVDVIQVLTESAIPRRYWSDLKRKLAAEGSELYEKIVQLKLPSSDGKKYLTDVATTEQLFRLIQSIPSKKAEPFKLWLAEVGRQRLEQLQDPEQSIEQAIRDYRRLGYSEAWINQRIKTIEVRKALTDEWKRGGMQEDRDYAAPLVILPMRSRAATSSAHSEPLMKEFTKAIARPLLLSMRRICPRL